MSRIFKVPIIEKKEITPDIIEVVFDVSKTNFSFEAGQYIRLSLPKLLHDDPRGNYRDFSIASSPNEQGIIRLAIRESESGFKHTLFESPIGFECTIAGPFGTFTLPSDTSTSSIFIAGGIGITSFIGKMRFATENNLPHKITLIYCNKTTDHVPYAEEIQSIAKKNPNITVKNVIGAITPKHMKEFLSDTSALTKWQIAGPPAMSAAAKNILIELGVDEKAIKSEEFVGYESGTSKIASLSRTFTIQENDLTQALLSVLDQNALITVTDAEGTLIYVNDLFLSIAKYSRDEAIGQNHRLLKSGFHPPYFFDDLWGTISSGKIWHGEVKNTAKDGSPYWVDTTIRPIFNSHGVITNYVSFRFPITERKETEQQLVSERRKLSMILGRLSVGVAVIKTPEGNVESVNPRGMELLGTEALANNEAELFSLYHLETETGDPYPITNFSPSITAQTGKMSSQRDIWVNRSDGSKINLKVTSNPILNAVTGAVESIIVIFDDITKEHELDKSKDEFVSFASHQLRTPLTAIGGYTQILLDEDAGPINDDQRESLLEISKANKRMVDLINGLLNISKIDMGLFSVVPSPTDIVELAEIVLKEVSFDVQSKHLKVGKKFADDIPKTINFDPNLIKIILQNLVSNAVKYTKEKGTVTVSIEKSDKDILIKVADTGIGIPKNQQNKIFSKLFRADNARVLDATGTGLGMYIVKSIVEAVGGSLRFESEENVGTTFFASFPASGMVKREGSKGLL